VEATPPRQRLQLPAHSRAVIAPSVQNVVMAAVVTEQAYLCALL
jgi:hypothetical protein